MKSAPLILAILGAAYGCGNKVDTPAISSSTTTTSNSLTINVTGAEANRLIAVSVVNESTRRSVSGYHFDFTAGGDKADGTGKYTKTVTGLATGNTYTIIVRSDVNGDIVQDTNDKGQVLTGVAPGTTASLTNLQILSTLGATASTDAALANKTAGCTLGAQNYQTIDLSAGTSIGYVGAVAIIYGATGAATISSGHFPPGSYGNIMCAVDMNGNQTMDTGDKYQFINGPIILATGSDSAAFTIGIWSTF